MPAFSPEAEKTSTLKHEIKLMKAWAVASTEERRQFVERAGTESIRQTLSTTL
jgi:hypothetical protein